MPDVIEVENLSKRYRKGRGHTSLRESLLRGGRSSLADNDFHWAVRDVSFSMQPGEALGIIGPNGAGKTTILKLLSQVTKPTAGAVRVNGRFSALIELGAGFHPDLTGRENIFLNGAILGMKRNEIRQRFDRIVDFAGVGDFLDTPVKRYSSGMHARLGFAVAAHVDPEVLLVDEVLAVGDHAFQQRCHARMDQLRANGTSLIFVSHNFDAVRRICERGLVMYQGSDIYQGSAADAVVAYSDVVRQAARQANGNLPTEGGLAGKAMSFDAEIVDVVLEDVNGRPITMVESGDDVIVRVQVHFYRPVRQPIFALTIYSADGQLIYDTTTQWQGIQTPNFDGGETVQVVYRFALPLLAGQYDLGVDLAAADLSHYHDRLERALSFTIWDVPGARGIADLGASFEIVRLQSAVTAGNGGRAGH